MTLCAGLDTPAKKVFPGVSWDKADKEFKAVGEGKAES